MHLNCLCVCVRSPSRSADSLEVYHEGHGPSATDWSATLFCDPHVRHHRFRVLQRQTPLQLHPEAWDPGYRCSESIFVSHMLVTYGPVTYLFHCLLFGLAHMNTGIFMRIHRVDFYLISESIKICYLYIFECQRDDMDKLFVYSSLVHVYALL